MALVLLKVDPLRHHDTLVVQNLFLGFNLSHLSFKMLFGLFKIRIFGDQHCVILLKRFILALDLSQFRLVTLQDATFLDHVLRLVVQNESLHQLVAVCNFFSQVADSCQQFTIFVFHFVVKLLRLLELWLQSLNSIVLDKTDWGWLIQIQMAFLHRRLIARFDLVDLFLKMPFLLG